MSSGQLSLPTILKHNNQQLFSDHYLDTILPQRAEWAASVERSRVAIDEIAKIFAAYTPSDREAQLENDVVRPVLSILGHHYEVQPSLKTPDGTKVPDYVLYTDASARDLNKNVVLSDTLPNQGGIAVADAKYWDRPLDIAATKKSKDLFNNKNPSFQIAFYIQHSGVEWGILTNGRLWRLYHRDTAHKLDRFYEVDLPQLLATDDVASFLYFWLFFSRGAFADSPISLREILRQSQDYARAVGDSLKLQVFDALRHLAQGFMDYSGNGLKPTPDTLSQAYDSSLILLYRLLFILFAEARDLLPVRESQMYRETYGLVAIKKAVANDITAGRQLLPTSATLWPRLKELFDFIDKGNPPLKIATFNGGLFDAERHKFLDKYIVGDARLRQAIDGLARFKEHFIDYRDLSVRHLGAIYEGLLEYKLSVMPAPASGWSVELVNDKGDRKATGSYYTPDYIVKYIVEETVKPMLDAAVYGKSADASRIEAILNVNVLDPAMGSGHFLVEATEYIARYLVDLAVPSDAAQLGETDVLHWKRRVAQSCIYGVDLNPLAVELAKLSLWLTTVAKDCPLSFLDHHLRTGNALVGARLADLQIGGKKPKVKKASTEAKNEAAGQLSMTSEPGFVQSMGLAVGNMWLIEQSDSRTIDDVKNQEKLYTELRKAFMRKHGRVADLITASHFGLDVGDDLWTSLKDYASKSQKGYPAFDRIMTQSDTLAENLHFFHWEIEFPEVFFDRTGHSLGDAAGFDAVIGNPPYIRQEKLAQFKPFFKSSFAAFNSVADLYIYFFEQGLKILQSGGRLAYISSGTFARANFAGAFRKWLPTTARIDTLIDFGENQPFEGAEMVRPSIMVLRKDQDPRPFTSLMIDGKVPSSLEYALIEDGIDCDTKTLEAPEWVFQHSSSGDLIKRIFNTGKSLKQVVGSQIYYGVKTGLNEAFVIDGHSRNSIINANAKTNELIKCMLRGEDLRPWYQEEEDRHVIIIPNGWTDRRFGPCADELEAWRLIKDDFPELAHHLGPFADAARARSDQGKYWWELRACDYYDKFESPKIFWPDICKLPRFSIDTSGKFINDKGFIIETDDPFILGVLQSRVSWYGASQISTPLRLRAGLWQYQLKSQFISRLTIPDASAADRHEIGDLALQITAIARDRYTLHQKARARLITDFARDGKTLNNKLTAWWDIDFPTLRSELQKALKADIPVKDRDDWGGWLASSKSAHSALTRQIVDLETELNDRVYGLFGLTDDERKVIEESTKYAYGEV